MQDLCTNKHSDQGVPDGGRVDLSKLHVHQNDEYTRGGELERKGSTLIASDVLAVISGYWMN